MLKTVIDFFQSEMLENDLNARSEIKSYEGRQQVPVEVHSFQDDDSQLEDLYARVDKHSMSDVDQQKLLKRQGDINKYITVQ